jgi:hypothetical protein
MNPESLAMIDSTPEAPRLTPGSQVYQLVNLGLSENISVTSLMPRHGYFSENVAALRRQMTNTMNKSIQRAKKARPNMAWSIETGVTITSNNDPYVTLIVTRVE